MYVFVYGTLKKGQANHQFIEKNVTYVGEATLEGYMLFYSAYVGSFPVMIPQDASTVYGEVFEANEDAITTMDQIEAEGYLYNRKKVKVKMNGKMVTVSTYVGNKNVWGDASEYYPVGVNDHKWDRYRE